MIKQYKLEKLNIPVTIIHKYEKLCREMNNKTRILRSYEKEIKEYQEEITEYEKLFKRLDEKCH